MSMQDGVSEGCGGFLRHVVAGFHGAYVEQCGQAPLVSGAGQRERYQGSHCDSITTVGTGIGG
jgi:hypothetical protein